MQVAHGGINHPDPGGRDGNPGNPVDPHPLASSGAAAPQQRGHGDDQARPQGARRGDRVRQHQDRADRGLRPQVQPQEPPSRSVPAGAPSAHRARHHHQRHARRVGGLKLSRSTSQRGRGELQLFPSGKDLKVLNLRCSANELVIERVPVGSYFYWIEKT